MTATEQYNFPVYLLTFCGVSFEYFCIITVITLLRLMLRGSRITLGVSSEDSAFMVL